MILPIRTALVNSIILGCFAAACAAPAPPSPPPANPTTVQASAPTTPASSETAIPTPAATRQAPTPAPTPSLAPTAAPVPLAVTSKLVATPAGSTNPANIATPTREEQVSAPGPATETSTIAAEFEAALNSGRVGTALGLFADNAVVKIPPDRYVGATQIGNWLRYLAAIHFEIEPGYRRVVAEQASWPAEIRSDFLDHIGLPSLNGEASLVVNNGRIESYTFFLTEDSARRHRDALLHASEVLQDPVIVGQDAANVYGFNDVFFDADGHTISYRDVLTAEPGSGPFHDLGGQPVVIRSGY